MAGCNMRSLWGKELMAMINYLRQIYVGIVNAVRSERGQTLVEYALLLILIAIVVVLIVKGIGLTTNNSYSKVNSALQG